MLVWAATFYCTLRSMGAVEETVGQNGEVQYKASQQKAGVPVITRCCCLEGLA